jgi:uncharacterized phage protein (TIGR01671 family)
MQNREIKFRVWDDESKKWVDHSVLLTAEGKMKQLFVDGENTFHCFSVTGDRLFYQQGTGLKDKNGREIYEGDLCNRENWSGNPYYVKYSRDGWFWCRHNEAEKEFLEVRDCKYDMDRLRNGVENCEIIGNIFENPELLNDQKP